VTIASASRSVPAYVPGIAGTHCVYPLGMARLSLPRLHTEMVYPSTNLLRQEKVISEEKSVVVPTKTN